MRNADWCSELNTVKIFFKQNQAKSHSFTRLAQKVDQTSWRLRDAYFLFVASSETRLTTLQNYEHYFNVLTRRINHFIKSKNRCLCASNVRKTRLHLFFRRKNKRQYPSQKIIVNSVGTRIVFCTSRDFYDKITTLLVSYFLFTNYRFVICVLTITISRANSIYFI